MSGVTRENKISNKDIRESIEVALIFDKMEVYRWKWPGSILRREKTEAVKLVKEMFVDRKWW